MIFCKQQQQTYRAKALKAAVNAGHPVSNANVALEHRQVGDVGHVSHDGKVRSTLTPAHNGARFVDVRIVGGVGRSGRRRQTDFPRVRLLGRHLQGLRQLQEGNVVLHRFEPGIRPIVRMADCRSNIYRLLAWLALSLQADVVGA